MNTSFKKKVYEIVFESKAKFSLGWYFDFVIVILILLNVVAIVLESISTIYLEHYRLFYYFEVFTVVTFTIEYILRIYCITEEQKFFHPIKGRLKYSITPYAIIDLLAILPFYLFHFFADFRLFRILRLLRLVRFLKIFRFLNAVSLIDDVLVAKKDELIISFIIILNVLFISSSLMYYCEHQVQPEVFSSIPQTMWWGAMTLTTVGYGDVYPMTASGKILGSVISILGIGVFALPTAILASGFSDAVRKSADNKSQK